MLERIHPWRTSILWRPSVARHRHYRTVPELHVSKKRKVWDSADQAVQDVQSGDVLLCGGFGLAGIPSTLVEALAKRQDVKGLVVVSNNAGQGDLGVAKLINTGHLDKLIASYPGGNKSFQERFLAGKVSLELVPQGTLVERLRAHAAGIPAFYTPTGASTLVEEGGIPIRYEEGGLQHGVKIQGAKKEAREFNGRRYILETAIPGDVAFIRAWKVDEIGNCVFRYTAQNFSPVMAKNAKLTIVEAERIVPVGIISPNAIHLPGIYVDRIVQATTPKHLEPFTLASHSASSPEASSSVRDRIAKRAAKEIKDGYTVNLGIGIPNLVSQYLDPGIKVWVQSENGMLGMGPYAEDEERVDPDIVNAGKEPVTMVPGASTFDSAESFAMIRGGHVDVSILGALQVSEGGDIANFMIPGKMVNGIGGAMDLVSNPDKTRVIAVMEHCAKDGSPKIVKQCTLPLTGARAVGKIITELAAFDVDRVKGGLVLTDVQEGVSVEEVRAKTGCEFDVA